MGYCCDTSFCLFVFYICLYLSTAFGLYLFLCLFLSFIITLLVSFLNDSLSVITMIPEQLSIQEASFPEEGDPSSRSAWPDKARIWQGFSETDVTEVPKVRKMTFGASQCAFPSGAAYSRDGFGAEEHPWRWESTPGVSQRCTWPHLKLGPITIMYREYDQLSYNLESLVPKKSALLN